MDANGIALGQSGMKKSGLYTFRNNIFEIQLLDCQSRILMNAIFHRCNY